MIYALMVLVVVAMGIACTFFFLRERKDEKVLPIRPIRPRSESQKSIDSVFNEADGLFADGEKLMDEFARLSRTFTKLGRNIDREMVEVGTPGGRAYRQGAKIFRYERRAR